MKNWLQLFNYLVWLVACYCRKKGNFKIFLFFCKTTSPFSVFLFSWKPRPDVTSCFLKFVKLKLKYYPLQVFLFFIPGQTCKHQEWWYHGWEPETDARTHLDHHPPLPGWCFAHFVLQTSDLYVIAGFAADGSQTLQWKQTMQ